MALINCPECSNEISESAVSCPSCGYLVRRVKQGRKISKKLRIVLYLVLCLLIFLIVAILRDINSEPSKPLPITYINKAVHLDEGRRAIFEFQPLKSSGVTIDIQSGDVPVDQVLMRKTEYIKYNRGNESVYDGAYKFHKSFSRRGITNFRGTQPLAADEWVLMVIRPKESILFPQQATVQVKVTGYW